MRPYPTFDVAGDLSATDITDALTGRFGRPLRFLDETASTNSDALAWAKDGAAEGSLVVAEHQTAGRGRWGRVWLSEPGRALLFTVLLRPQLPPASSSLLTTAIGVACAEGIEDASGLAVALRWPNDLTIGGRKLGGILVESHVESGSVSATAAGVGINVHWTETELPAELATSATSVAVELARSGVVEVPSRVDLLAAILARMEVAYDELTTSPGGVVARASDRSAVIGSRVRIRFADGTTRAGLATRLLPSGALELDTQEGIAHVTAGEIERLSLG